MYSLLHQFCHQNLLESIIFSFYIILRALQGLKLHYFFEIVRNLQIYNFASQKAWGNPGRFSTNRIVLHHTPCSTLPEFKPSNHTPTPHSHHTHTKNVKRPSALSRNIKLQKAKTQRGSGNNAAQEVTAFRKSTVLSLWRRSKRRS